MENNTTDNCILIVDDDFINRELLKNIFSSQFTFEEAGDGEEGLAQIRRHMDKLCAIILDVQMPKLTGIELLEQISSEGITDKIPTFLITARDDDELMNAAYRFGVMDVVTKPVVPIVIQKRVKTVIELFNARKALSETVKGQEKKLYENAKLIDELNRGAIETLATAIEFRDIESGQHVNRIYGITKYILSNTEFGEGLSEDEIENIARGAIMHDVGKIAISDVILNKPGRLTKEEFEEMKLHTCKGAELLEQICKIHAHDSYLYAADIARHHHERWDGRGYPDGLVGDEISIASQAVSIADVYDALVSVRVYKKAFTPDEAVNMIMNGECGTFNPKLIECFLKAEPAIRRWYLEDQLTEMPEAAVNDKDSISNKSSADNSSMNVSVSGAAMDVMLLMAAVQAAYDMIISVNLTKNTYHMIDYARFQTHCADNRGSFDELIEYGSSSVPVSHRKEFHDTFCRENLFRLYREGKKSVSLEHPQYSDDGKLHWVSTSVLFMEDGRSGDLMQITISRYIDEENEERERTRKVLTDAMNLAEHANSSKQDFLSAMSHDIRTPLNSIIGMTTIIAANLDNTEKISDCLVKIGSSSKILLGAVNNAVDFFKIENSSLSLRLMDFNLRDLITEIAGETTNMAQNKHHNVTVSIDENLSNSYIGDEFRIRQILINLLENAYTYTPEYGSYSLTVNVSQHSDEYDILQFTVKDNGIGIRPEFIKKVFDPFARDKETNTTESMGLGLSISQNLAHLMNGDIIVTSKLGEGSVFTFELPLEKGSLTAYSEIIDTDLNVLVVDDDTVVCEHTAILLHNMGITATVASNGFDAVELVKINSDTDNAFDVAIVDWQMPQMDGIETVRQIRKVVGDNVLVVVMSAFDWTEIEDEAREAGVDLFLSKPISEANLRTAIACSEKIRWEQQDIRFSGEKFLIAEDNPLNAEIAKTILEMKNLTVEVATNGREAYEMFMASQPDEYLAILMDITMPEMDGCEAVRAIRASAHVSAKTIPIYAMTANTFRNDIIESKLAGMNGHIAKPIDFDEVTRILKSIINNHSKGGFHGKL